MRTLIYLFFVLSCLSAYAVEDNFAFDDPQRRALFITLTEELRCPMCQNQNIADSDAMIAHDMRRKVYTLLKQGKSEQEIIDYMKARYGDFVYYQPPVTVATLWLWLLPVLFAISVSFFVLRKRNANEDSQSEEKLKQAEAMLKRDKS